MKIIALLIVLISPLGLFGQSYFEGQIIDENGEALIAATVFWEANEASATTTDADGWFRIERPNTTEAHQLEIHYVGYKTSVVEILPNENNIAIALQESAVLEEVTVEENASGTTQSLFSNNNIETITSKELTRAACCSLAESFETNASVNVTYTDAVTGAREIEMLGLRGIYTQMMVENRPALNGLDLAYGMEYYPGTWIKAIQISKGASSVRSGAQGMTGQININLQKPEGEEPLFLNLYLNRFGRTELNAHFHHKINDKLRTTLLAHGNMLQTEIDHNGDGFMDTPQKRQLNLLSRWLYNAEGLHAELNVQGILDEKSGGQLSALDNPYTLQINTRRAEAFGKLGYFGFAKPTTSLALIARAYVHEQNAQFGNRLYSGLQRGGYGQFLFQTALDAKADQNLYLGANYQYDDYQERFSDIDANRYEQWGGIYSEYSLQKDINPDKGTAYGVTAGLRGDYLQMQSTERLLFVPRLNAKYNLSNSSVIRASAGRGWRMPKYLMENIAYMASNRAFVLSDELPEPEVSWNVGLNYTQSYYLGQREGSIGLDVYRTSFENQLVSDIDSDAGELRLYNLNGASFSNNFLLNWSQELIPNLSMRLAYKFSDVQTTFGDSLFQRALVARHRGLANLSYELPKKGWQFDATVNIVGPQRLPQVWGSTEGLPQYRIDERSPAYALINAQVTKRFKNWEVYVGAENLGNYRQEQPILGADDPFATSTAGNATQFDAASVFAPIMGSNVYLGIRMRLGEKLPEQAAHGCASGVEQTSHDDHDHLTADNFDATIYTSSQCGMCKTTIEKGLNRLKGIEEAILHVENKTLYVNYDEKQISLTQIREAVSGLGYDADGVTANPEAYEQLPACCKKDGVHSK